MAASGPENIISSPSGDPSPGRRAHTYSRLTTAIAVLALAAAIYALIRTDSIRGSACNSQFDDETLALDAESGAVWEQRSRMSISSRDEAFSETPGPCDWRVQPPARRLLLRR